MRMIIRGESVLNNTLDKLEKIKNKKVNRKNKKNNNNNNSNDNDKDQPLIQKEDTDLHKTYEESDKSEEDTVDKVETEKSESEQEQEPESEQDETIVKKLYSYFNN